MEPTIEELQAARKVLVRIIQSRDDRAKFVPLVLALEKYVANKQALKDDLTRILVEVA